VVAAAGVLVVVLWELLDKVPLGDKVTDHKVVRKLVVVAAALDELAILTLQNLPTAA
jgi:hypothetical protein